MTALELGEGQLQTQAADGQKFKGAGQISLDELLARSGNPVINPYYVNLSHIGVDQEIKHLTSFDESKDLALSTTFIPFLTPLVVEISEFLNKSHIRSAKPEPIPFETLSNDILRPAWFHTILP